MEHNLKEKNQKITFMLKPKTVDIVYTIARSQKRHMSEVVDTAINYYAAKERLPEVDFC
jgi:hypothetical protein